MSVPEPTTVPPPPSAAEQLPDDTATLKRLVLELLASLHEERHDNEALRHRIELLLRRLYGPRGERFDPNQALLFPEMAAGQDTAAPTEPAAAPKPKRRCRPHGRRRLPENLPREPRHYELSEAERICRGCGQMRIDIGTDRSEQLDYRPASLFVVEHFVHKYVCPCCSKRSLPSPGQRAEPGQESEPMPPRPTEDQPPPPSDPAPASAATDTRPEPISLSPQTADPSQRPQAPAQPFLIPDPGEVVIAAPKPALPIAKGLPGPGLLAHLIVSKYTDHMPLHRLQRSYERQGFFLQRSTLCDWLGACADLLRPLYELMACVVLQSRALHTDDTTVKLQDPVTHLLSTARLWGYLGDIAHPYNVFDFTVNRKRDGPEQFLVNDPGLLACGRLQRLRRAVPARPAYVAGTHHRGGLQRACAAEIFKARSTDTLRAHQALAYYRQLYELERAAKDFSDEQRLQMRQELAVPILAQFHAWLLAQRPQVLPKSPMAEAIGYALNNWEALKRYTEAGFLAIDNNVSEREMKRIAIDRKNWLFVGSARGGQTAAVLMSFTSTCQRLGIEPWAYLQDVLTRLPELPAEQLCELLPDRWEAARRARQASQPTPAPSAPSPSAQSPS